MDAANNVINLLKDALKIAQATSTIAGNLTDLCAIKPDGGCVPCVKECTTISSASSKSKLETAYYDAKQ